MGCFLTTREGSKIIIHGVKMDLTFYWKHYLGINVKYRQLKKLVFWVNKLYQTSFVSQSWKNLLYLTKAIFEEHSSTFLHISLFPGIVSCILYIQEFHRTSQELFQACRIFSQYSRMYSSIFRHFAFFPRQWLFSRKFFLHFINSGILPEISGGISGM